MTESKITPPPELRSQWFNETPRADIYDYIIEKAAQWGADQELEACCEWVGQWCGRWPDGTRPEGELRAARRPKPLSLKQQALEAFERFTSGENGIADDMRDGGIIRRALEALPDEELGQ